MVFAVRHTSSEAYYSVVSIKHPQTGKVCFGALIGEIHVLVDHICMLTILNDPHVYAEIGIIYYLSSFVRHFVGKDRRYDDHHFTLGLVSSTIFVIIIILSYNYIS